MQRNQIQTLNYLVTATAGGVDYTHSYTVSPDPCDAGFTGTGQYPAAPAPATYDEVLSGSVAGQPGPGVALSYTDQYIDPGTGHPTGYTYSFVGHFTDAQGDFVGTANGSDGQSNIPVTGQITGASQTNYANHGQFVSANPNKNDAAHSCVGMPVQSRQQ